MTNTFYATNRTELTTGIGLSGIQQQPIRTLTYFSLPPQDQLWILSFLLIARTFFSDSKFRNFITPHWLSFNNLNTPTRNWEAFMKPHNVVSINHHQAETFLIFFSGCDSFPDLVSKSYRNRKLDGEFWWMMHHKRVSY